MTSSKKRIHTRQLILKHFFSPITVTKTTKTTTKKEKIFEFFFLKYFLSFLNDISQKGIRARQLILKPLLIYHKNKTSENINLRSK